MDSLLQSRPTSVSELLWCTFPLPFGRHFDVAHRRQGWTRSKDLRLSTNRRSAAVRVATTRNKGNLCLAIAASVPLLESSPRDLLRRLWEMARSRARGPTTDAPEHGKNLLEELTLALGARQRWSIKALISVLEATAELQRTDKDDADCSTNTCSAIFRIVVREIGEQVDCGAHLDVSQIPRIFKALAKGGFQSQELFSAVDKTFSRQKEVYPHLVLRPSGISEIVHSMSAMSCVPAGQETAMFIAAACLSWYKGLQARDIAVAVMLLANTKSTTSVESCCAPLSTIAPAVEAVLPRCDMRDLADIARSYARTPEAAPLGFFDAIALRATKCVDKASPQDVARVVGAFHHLQLQPEALLEVVEVWADRRLAALSPQALALALASFARLGNCSPRLLNTAARCVENVAGEMHVSELAKVVWAFARLEYSPGHIILDRAMHAVQSAPQALADKETANLLWGLAKLGFVPSMEAVHVLCLGLTPIAGKYSGQSAALVLWSLAKVCDDDHRRYFINKEARLVDILGYAVARDVHCLDPQSASLGAWSLGTLGLAHPRLCGAVVGRCQRDPGWLEAFEPQHMANMLWGLVKAGNVLSKEEDFFVLVANACASKLHTFAPPELFALCWAFATVKRAPYDLLNAAVAQFCDRYSEFGPLELSGMCWALSRLLDVHAHNGGEANNFLNRVLLVMIRELPQKLPVMEATQIGMATWALGKMVKGLPVTRSPFDPLKNLQETIDPLFLVIEGRASSDMGPATVVSVVEGLANLRAEPPRAVKSTLSRRLVVLVPMLRPWEFASLAFHLTQVGMTDAASALLMNERASRAAANAPPHCAIWFLAAMARCGQVFEHVFEPCRERLVSLAPSYRLDRAALITLHEALNDLPREYSARITLSPAWQNNMRNAISNVN